MTTELDRLRAENARLRDALRRIDESAGIVRRDVSLGIEGGDEADWAEVQDLACAALAALAALAATPPAAEPAGQGDGLCPYCNGSGEDSAEARYAVEHAKGRSVSAWCGRCNGTGKQQEARP